MPNAPVAATPPVITQEKLITTPAQGLPDTTSKTPEPQKAATPPEQTPEERDRYAALARQTKAIRVKQRELAEKEVQLKSSVEQQIAQARSEWEKQWKQRLSEDPLSVLEEHAVTYEQLTQKALEDKNPEITALRRELQKLRQERDQEKTQAKDQQAQAYERAKQGITMQVKSLVEARPDDFELIKSQGVETRVTDYIEKVYQAEGIVLDTEDAAKEVEELLAEQALALAKAKKVQARLSPPAPAPESGIEASPTPQPQVKTLSNRQVQASAKPLTAEERRQRAIAAFQGKLNS